jgi:hypothetical protein
MYQDMEERRRRWEQGRGEGRLLMGLVVIGMGVLFLLQNLGYVYVENVWEFWPAILLVMGVSRMANCRSAAGMTSGVMLTVIGGLFLAVNLGYVPHNWIRLFWPLLLILFGVSMLVRSLDGGGRGFGGWGQGGPGPDWGARFRQDTSTSSNTTHQWVIFSGAHRRVSSQEYEGGDVLAVFGGVKLDLRGAATTRPEIYVEANALFGGVDIRVPESWKVTMRGMGIFGAFEEDHRNADVVRTGGPHLIVTGTAMFGAVVVKK